jgi:hypothetical protein
MTHSGVSGVTLPINAPINELRLPTMTALTLNGLEQLEDSQFSFGTYEYYDGETAIGEYSGVEVEGKGY